MLGIRLEVTNMKKFAILILALSLMCGVLTGCASDRGNISDNDNGVVTDSPNDDNSIIDDDMIDDDQGSKGGNNSDSGNNNGNNKDAVPTSIPGESPSVASQPVTP